MANLATTTNGVITSENALFDEILGTTGATGNANTNLINITDNTHPITAGLPLGNYDVGDAAFYVNNVVSGQKLGDHPNGQAVLIAWEEGEAMDTGTAPGRRAVLPLTNSNGGFNANGEDLLVSAIIWTGNIDTDKDGTDDHLDLDSDNDGVYDVVEAGHYIGHSSGVLTTAVGLDGISNAVQASGQEDSGTFNYTVADSDSDGIIDAKELDADADGCEDVIEAGYTDDNSDGQLGPSPITVDANGLVTSGSDGYTTPVDADSNSVFDFQEAGTSSSIDTQPANLTICPGCSGTFSVTASNADTYQWQIYDGTTWVNLTDSGIHSGTTTATLNVTNVTPSDNGNQYRVVVSNSLYICDILTSNFGILTVNVSSVITNRRITYRVKKN